jgi:hypothetical protein
MSETTINPTVERPHGGMGGGLPLLALPLLLAGAVFAFTQELPIAGRRVWCSCSSWRLAASIRCSRTRPTSITLFGSYVGTDRVTGLRWILPWYGRKKISLRVRNVTSEMLKVNDKRGNPIEIAANIVWRVQDSAQALFDVDDYIKFVNIQIETGLREVATHYAYDHAEEGEPTLRAHAEEVGDRLRKDLAAALRRGRHRDRRGAPDASGLCARDRRLDAEAPAGRSRAGRSPHDRGRRRRHGRERLEQLSERGVVTLDDDRAAAMVSNLLVVLCADREAQPVVNTGTLYG